MESKKSVESTDSTSIAQPTLDGSIGDGCRVLLIRHGRSADVIPGTPESANPPLHELGQKQAIALGVRLSTSRIDAVYSSHLLRALHTAKAVADHHRLEVGVFEDLEEVRLGDWSHGEFRRRAASSDPAYVDWSQTGTWDGIPNGEGDQQFRHRVTTRINALAKQHDGGVIAVVCHGGVINAYVAAMLGTQRSLWMMVENTSITAIKLNATPSVLILNDCTHLYDILQ